MNGRSFAAIAVWTCGLALAWVLVGPLAASVRAGDAGQKGPAASEAADDDLFGLAAVATFHLTLSAKEYDAMQPTGGIGFPGGPGGPGAPGGPPARPASKPGEAPRDSDRSVFGTEFPWVHGDLTVADTTYEDVGIRYKGNSTYMAAARGPKRSFKIELDRYDDEQRFHGLKSLNLHCDVLDPTKGRESLAYALFRAAGVPAPRTAFVEVRLTVPGKYDDECLGLYTLVEQVDKGFLKHRFPAAKGLLMKPERIRGIDFLGDEWERYKGQYQPKRDATKEEAARVIEFARLINQAGDEQFNKEIDSYLDVDEFLRFLAANALLVNMDSFFTLGHNYYLYLNPETNRFVFIPWDLDLSMANFAMMGSPEQLMDLSLAHPYAGENKLTDRLLAREDVKRKYEQVLQDLAAKCFAKAQLLEDVGAIEKATQEIVSRETKAAAERNDGAGGFGFGPPGGGMFGPTIDLRTFVEKRTKSIQAQLAGTSKGYLPVMGFGPGGPGGFGPGGMFAGPIVRRADADKDGKVTLEEFMAAAEALFQECDQDKKGVLEEKDIAAGIGRLFPPPNFGPQNSGQRGGRPPGTQPPNQPAQAPDQPKLDPEAPTRQPEG